MRSCEEWFSSREIWTSSVAAGFLFLLDLSKCSCLLIWTLEWYSNIYSRHFPQNLWYKCLKGLWRLFFGAQRNLLFVKIYLSFSHHRWHCHFQSSFCRRKGISQPHKTPTNLEVRKMEEFSNKGGNGVNPEILYALRHLEVPRYHSHAARPEIARKVLFF